MIAVLVGGVIIVLLSVLLGIALGKLDREKEAHESDSRFWHRENLAMRDRLLCAAIDFNEQRRAADLRALPDLRRPETLACTDPAGDTPIYDEVASA